MVDQKLCILRRRFLKNSIAYLCTVVSLSCLFILLLSAFRLPEASFGVNTAGSRRTTELGKFAKDRNLGIFGDMMIEMLPQALAFTVFVPSERAFEHDLRLHVKESLAVENINNTYAIVSRVLGFTAVPRVISPDTIPVGKEISYDSLSGFILYISRGVDGMLVVNGVRSESVNIRRGEVIVHIMEGVIMDADFRQSFQSDDDVEG